MRASAGLLLALLCAQPRLARPQPPPPAPPPDPDPWTHDWSAMAAQLWVDFGARSGGLTAAQLAFVARTYAVVSLEKCFNGAQFPGDTAAGAANASRGIRAAAAAARAPPPRILYYFHSQQAFDSCYTSAAAFEARQDWWLRNASGGAIWAGQGHMYNTSRADVRAHVAQSSVAVPDAAGLFDGVFADGTADTGVNSMAAQAQRDYFASHHQSVAETAAAVHAAMRPGARLFGNGLSAYNNNPPDHGWALVPFLDGFCYEHFLGFESLNAATGALIPSQFALAAALIRNATDAGKPVLVRAWPGPVCQPIRSMGPSWCGPTQPAPATYPLAAAALQQLLTPALAGYLIVATNITYFSYSWWYTEKDGMMPCVTPGACSFPEGWYPDLARPLGAPRADAVFDAAAGTYTRDFEHAHVVFNVTNMSASVITWIPPSASPSAAPPPDPAPAAGSSAATVSAAAAVGATVAVLAVAAVAAAAAAVYTRRTRGGVAGLRVAGGGMPRMASPISIGERVDSTRIMLNPVLASHLPAK